MSEYTLRVGESVKLIKHIFKASYTLVYGGMPGDAVYTVIVTYHYGNNSMAYNLYFRKSEREITICGRRIIVHGISPHEIKFQLPDQTASN